MKRLWGVYSAWIELDLALKWQKQGGSGRYEQAAQGVTLWWPGPAGGSGRPIVSPEVWPTVSIKCGATLGLPFRVNWARFGCRRAPHVHFSSKTGGKYRTTDKWLNIPTEFRLKIIGLGNGFPLAAYWGGWCRYLELGRQKSGIGATIGRFGSLYYRTIWNKLPKMTFFSVLGTQRTKKEKWYRISFNLPILHHWSALEGTSRYFF